MRLQGQQILTRDVKKQNEDGGLLINSLTGKGEMIPLAEKLPFITLTLTL